MSPEIRGRWPDVPWRSVTGFRTIAVHTYFEVDWSIVWRIATTALRELHVQLLMLLKAEFPLVASRACSGKTRVASVRSVGCGEGE